MTSITPNAAIAGFASTPTLLGSPPGNAQYMEREGERSAVIPAEAWDFIKECSERLLPESACGGDLADY
ncbi:hypothetical protein [Cupriavidus sp. SK-4]|uniref:hypothetical protein n=1 Tax=Cupriavidus sp. SK-4 TaxID=574750 RepID=UPI0012691362|nr:hypothetical protein [Cupriavidus sp. SK-4]